MCIRAYGTSVSGRDGRNPKTQDRDPYTDPPCTLAERNSTTTTGCTTTPMPRRRHINTGTTGAICNVSIQFQTNNNVLPPFFPFFSFFFGGNRGKGKSQSSLDSHFSQHPIYVLSDKTWRRPDRVIGGLDYGKQTLERNPTNISIPSKSL
jgi:hypothetical protein